MLHIVVTESDARRAAERVEDLRSLRRAGHSLTGREESDLIGLVAVLRSYNYGRLRKPSLAEMGAKRLEFSTEGQGALGG